MKRSGRQNQAFHLLRLTISDAFQDSIFAAEVATDAISKAAAAGRNVPGVDELVNTAYGVISNTPDSDPDIYHLARQAAINGPWIMPLMDYFEDITKSLADTSDRLARAASRKAATDVFFRLLNQDAVGSTRSVRYKDANRHPSAHFIRMYRTAHQGMKDAIENARGPDRINRKLATSRLEDICSEAVMRAARETRDSIRMCIAVLAILRRIIMEDTEESISDAASRAADIINKAVEDDPESLMINAILGDLMPRVTYYNSRRRAYDAAVREIHKICTDIITDAVGMCVVEALYETFVSGAYRTTNNKTFFRSNYRNALEAACAFDPQKDIAGFEKDAPLPAHTVTRWWMGNALRYLVNIDYVATAESQDNSSVMAFYEAAYEAAYESAYQEYGDSKTGRHR